MFNLSDSRVAVVIWMLCIYFWETESDADSVFSVEVNRRILFVWPFEYDAQAVF